MKQIFILLMFLPFIAFAQVGEVVVGDMTVSYDTEVQKEGGTLYYFEDLLVASVHDGVTLVYENELAVLEAHDTDDDGTLDAYLTLDENGEVSATVGPGAAFFERPAPVEFDELLGEEIGGDGSAAGNQDLVGSLDSITIPKYHNWLLYGFIALLVAGGGFWWHRKR